MTNDDKALVEVLRSMSETCCSGGCYACSTEKEAADRIEALSADNERLQFLCDLNAVPAGIIEDRGRMEERAAIVAWLLKDIGPWLRDEREEYAVEFAAAIEAGEHVNV